ncbi:TAP-like protein-domain-containing protein [Cytidiella melzeri]|nr:TAP-like protein-domain-containing protein [Cytidiella melzeri]
MSDKAEYLVTRDSHCLRRTRQRRVAGGFLVCAGLLALTWLSTTNCFSLAEAYFQMHPSQRKIGSQLWEKCDITGVEERTLCGSIVAPLDYFDYDAGTAEIALSLYPAKNLPSKGIVLFNPGGPGGSGREFVALRGPVLQALTGEDYDIIGFDPRGIGQTKPSMKCFTGGTTYVDFIRHTVLDRSYDLASTMPSAEARKHLVAQHKEAEALYKAQFKICEKTMGETMKYMGTSTVVRDIDFLTKHIAGEDALINFYGFSYGSILGQYLVNMLPDRIGRVVIDGVADAVAWSSKPYWQWYHQWLISTTDAYNIFVRRCSEVGATSCALANHTGEEPTDIKDRIEQLIDNLYYEPLAVYDSEVPGMLTAGQLRIFLLRVLQQPIAWPGAAIALKEAMLGNGGHILDALQQNPARDLQRSAVSCNDNAPFEMPPVEDIVDELLEVYHNVTRAVFSVVTTEPDAGCQNWPVSPPERFQGPWNHTLRNPILVFSNTADPVTPLDSGRKVVEQLGDSSRLVIQDSPGHCTLAMQSQCSGDVLRAYFADGTLPTPDTVCKTDSLPFDDDDSSSSLSAEKKLSSVFAEARRNGFLW